MWRASGLLAVAIISTAAWSEVVPAHPYPLQKSLKCSSGTLGMISRSVLAPMGWQFEENTVAAINHLLTKSAVLLALSFDIGSWSQRLRSCFFLIWSRVLGCSSGSLFLLRFSPITVLFAHFSIASSSMAFCLVELCVWLLIPLKMAAACCFALAASMITIPELQGPSGSHIVWRAIFPFVALCPSSGFVKML